MALNKKYSSTLKQSTFQIHMKPLTSDLKTENRDQHVVWKQYNIYFVTCEAAHHSFKVENKFETKPFNHFETDRSTLSNNQGHPTEPTDGPIYFEGKRQSAGLKEGTWTSLHEISMSLKIVPKMTKISSTATLHIPFMSSGQKIADATQWNLKANKVFAPN